MQDALLEEEGAQPEQGFGSSANAVSLRVPAAQARQEVRQLSAQEAHEVRFPAPAMCLSVPVCVSLSCSSRMCSALTLARSPHPCRLPSLERQRRLLYPSKTGEVDCWDLNLAPASGIDQGWDWIQR